MIVKYSNTLSHHGILGQKWGKRNGPPYPLDAEDHSAREKAMATTRSKKQFRRRFDEYGYTQNHLGAKNVYGDMSFYKESKVQMVENPDGSYTFPKGFVFNRVATNDTLRPNRCGAIYMSHGEWDAASYINSVSISPVANFKNPNKQMQHIKVVDDMKIMSEKQAVKTLLDYAAKNTDMVHQYNESKRTKTTKVGQVSDEEIKLAAKHPEHPRSMSIAWALYCGFGQTSKYGDTTAKYYDHVRKKGFDAIPDLYDIFPGNSSGGSTIVLNPDKVKMYSTTKTNHNMYKAAQLYVTANGGWKCRDFINPLLTYSNQQRPLRESDFK